VCVCPLRKITWLKCKVRWFSSAVHNQATLNPVKMTKMGSGERRMSKVHTHTHTHTHTCTQTHTHTRTQTYTHTYTNTHTHIHKHTHTHIHKQTLSEINICCYCNARSIENLEPCCTTGNTTTSGLILFVNWTDRNRTRSRFFICALMSCFLPFFGLCIHVCTDDLMYNNDTNNVYIVLCITDEQIKILYHVWLWPLLVS
jgi:hypothetical protein